MSYEPTVWKSGDIVTSAKLNKLEQGVAAGGSGGVLVVHAAQDDSGQYVLDKTWNEIRNAFISNGVVASLYDNTGLEAIVSVFYDGSLYGVVSFDGSAQTLYYADSPDDNPSMRGN